MPTPPTSVLKHEALTLALLSGYIDAYALRLFGSFVSFASGNTTMASLRIGAHDYTHALLYLAPILGFFLGGLAGALLLTTTHPTARRAVLFTAAIFLTTFALIHATVSIPATIAVAALSFTMGILNASIARVGSETINLTFVTGTIYKTANHLALALRGKRPTDALNARDTHFRRFLLESSIWLAFFAGALLSPFAAVLGHWQLAPACIVLFTFALLPTQRSFR